MPIVRLSVVLLGLSGVASACEAALDDIGAGGAGLPIVDGTRETGETAVVLIYHDRGAMCSATAISPRVVVTAKHCVQGLRADGWRVFVGSSPIRIIDEYRVTATRTAPGTGIEGSDIAVMLLASDFEYELKRWEFTPWPRFGRGSLVTSIGFGQTNPADGNSAGTKYRRDGYVRWLQGTREYVTDENNVCSGDSGGPSLFEDVLVGVASRGEEGCLGMGVMTRLSGFYDLIAGALRDTGGCVPTSFEVCDGVDNDCWGTIDDDLPNCRCAGGGSPAPETCNRIDDDCNNAIDDIANCACRAGAPPGEEVCNGIDDDCDEQIDEVCLRLGAPCSADSECASLLCAEVDGARVCTLPCTPGVGPACPDGGYCRGAACEPDGLCVPADGAGDALLGSRCTGNGECRSRFCEPTGGRCSLPCATGALACPATLACLAIGEACGACVPPGAAPTPRGFGEPCNGDADCLSGSCLVDGDPSRCGDECPYRYCTVSCGDGCPSGSHCRDGLCVRGEPSDPGETCISDADCTGGAICTDSGDVDRCILPCPAIGPCPDGTECADDGQCRPTTVLPGDPCGADGECSGGWCVWTGSADVCAAPCNGAGDCPSGLSCIPVDGGAALMCIPGWASGAPPADGCGCRAIPPSSGGPWASAGLLAFLAAAGRRRRRVSRAQ